MQHLCMLCEESFLLKVIRLQQSQCCCKAVAWLRKFSKFLEIHINYSVCVEYFMDTVLYALFLSLDSKALPMEQQRHVSLYNTPLH